MSSPSNNHHNNQYWQNAFSTSHQNPQGSLPQTYRTTELPTYTSYADPGPSNQNPAAPEHAFHSHAISHSIPIRPLPPRHDPAGRPWERTPRAGNPLPFTPPNGWFTPGPGEHGFGSGRRSVPSSYPAHGQYGPGYRSMSLVDGGMFPMDQDPRDVAAAEERRKKEREDRERRVREGAAQARAPRAERKDRERAERHRFASW
ncbi:hypothetical protein CC80DRAFT_494016 [Byssothecium circinans]|uniref:Uncharacterized protein n=1 Tax=Byssothecium circinans TaxID=147558 RepID=A0A6A5TPM1_9PLEO|nr:hypothetical protein CC80DRAFT_494016 [Byssothecium circinans]